jgi:hypothetical protein
MTPWLANLVRLVGTLQCMHGFCPVYRVVMKIGIVIFNLMLAVLFFVYRFCKPSDESKRQQKMAHILEKLILLTIEEVEMYPSIQAKIWGSIGQVCHIFWLHILHGCLIYLCITRCSFVCNFGFWGLAALYVEFVPVFQCMFFNL